MRSNIEVLFEEKLMADIIDTAPEYADYNHYTNVVSTTRRDIYLSTRSIKIDSRISSTLGDECISSTPLSISRFIYKGDYMGTIGVDDRPVHLYFGRELSHIKMTDENQKILGSQSRKIILCDSWEELSKNLNANVKSICFSATELEHSAAVDIVNMLRTLCKLVGIQHEFPITTSINKVVTYQSVKLLQKSGIFGIVPSSFDFGIDEAMKGVNAQSVNIPYWPKHILNQLPGVKRKTSTKSNEIILTPRQRQIYDLVSERGLSNKHIAKTLSITESTVKLHMGNILQKFGAKNRTQLVAFKKSKSKEQQEV